MKAITLSFLALFLCLQSAKAQLTPGSKPIYFVDSVKVLESEMVNLNPNDIASVTVIKDSSAVKLVGPEGRGGVIYIETNKFTTRSYWHYFRNKSAEYFKAVPDQNADSSVVYILNEQVLQQPVAGKLSTINESNFISLKVIDQSTLAEKYKMTDKNYGVVIVIENPIL